MSDCIWYLIAGVAVGWLTKIPFFLRYYKIWERENLEIWQVQKRVLELMKEKDM